MIKIKKLIIVLFILILILLINKEQESKVIIPSDSIRFRIIANSNDIADQKEKIEIRNELEPIFTNILNSNSKEETKNLINFNIPRIEEVLKNYSQNYNLNFGFNYFPEKTYKGITYPAGNYESLVITLGDGLGDNWWCVLFPPLCLLEAKGEDIDNYTYSFYIKEVLDRYI